MAFQQPRKTVGIIGSGVTGLAASSVLDKNGVRVILLEKEKHIGGHCYTTSYTDPNTKKSVDVDMGFMVLSPQTYNNFIEWLDEYNVELEDTNMSFSASLPNGFQWNSNDPLADKSIFSKFETLQLFWDLCRYEKILYDEKRASSSPDFSGHQTVADLQSKYHLSDAFMNYFLLPQCGSIWSMPADEIRNIPSEFITEFTFKHSLSCIWGRPIWKTVTGRSQVYVQKVLDRHFRSNSDGLPHFSGTNNIYKTECEVERLVFDYNGTGKIKIEYKTKPFSDDPAHSTDIVVDHVLFCCHAQYALQILNNSNIGPMDQEREILGAFEFGENEVILHGVKEGVMPRNPGMWAAWNYHTSHSGTVNVTYWLNLLQNLPKDIGSVFATLNPLPEQKEILEKEGYHIWNTQHPKYTMKSWSVIRDGKLDDIQCVKGRNVSFAGAWTSFGFHRDGFLSGTKEAWRILGKEYQPKPVVIVRGSSYWFSCICCLIHQVILFVLSCFGLSSSQKKRD